MYIIVLHFSFVTYIIYCCGLCSPQHNPVPPGCKIICPCACSRIICMEYIEAINNSLRSSCVYICGCVINVMHGYRHTHISVLHLLAAVYGDLWSTCLCINAVCSALVHNLLFIFITVVYKHFAL